MSKKSQIYFPTSNVKATDFRRIYRLDQMLQLNPIEFENFVGYLFHEAEKWRVETTKASGDGGIDLFLFKNGRMAVVQCKRYQKNVAASHVRDLYGTMMNQRASHAYIVTTGTISSPSREWARDKQITLIDGSALEKWARRVNPHAQAFVQLPQGSTQTPPVNIATPPISGQLPTQPFSVTLPQTNYVQPQPLVANKQFGQPAQSKAKINSATAKGIMYLTLTMIFLVVIIALLANLFKEANNPDNYKALAAIEVNATLPTTTTIPTPDLTTVVGRNLNEGVNLTNIPTVAPAPTPTLTPPPTALPRLKNAASEPCLVGQVKGNTISHFYHLPGWYYYTNFNASTPNVKCFESEAAAQAAGYKPGRQK